jgi:hypothetical protein
MQESKKQKEIENTYASIGELLEDAIKSSS